MNRMLEVVCRNGRVELPPDVRLTENTRVLVVLLEGNEPRVNGRVVLSAETQMEIVRRLRGIAKPDGTPPTDEEIREMYGDYLTEKYR